MKFSALALDYDGTIALNGAFDSSVREAIDEARRRGIVVVLVTGRRLSDLHAAAGDLTCFDVVVGENGAVLEFPTSGRRVLLGRPPSAAFLHELRRRGVPFGAGESVVEADAQWAGPILEAIRALEQPLILAFNRRSLMVLPQSIAKSTGLRQGLLALRVSIHNTVGIGDAENDHDLLDACEVGVAVGWGSPALRAIADEVIDGTGPTAVAEYIYRLLQQPCLSPRQMGRRRTALGHEESGEEVSLAIRGRTVLIAGEPGSGKSWLAGLLCEQSILQGYCLCIVDLRGDYRALESLPGVMTLGGDGPVPQPRQVVRALRYPDVSVILDVSRAAQPEKRDYLRTFLPMLMTMRRTMGLPHKIVFDEVQDCLSDADIAQLIDPEAAGYIFVTRRLSSVPEPVRSSDTVVMVTRETDPREAELLMALSRPQPCGSVSSAVFQHLRLTEAALLPFVEEARGRLRRFFLAPRLTTR